MLVGDGGRHYWQLHVGMEALKEFVNGLPPATRYVFGAAAIGTLAANLGVIPKYEMFLIHSAVLKWPPEVKTDQAFRVFEKQAVFTNTYKLCSSFGV